MVVSEIMISDVIQYLKLDVEDLDPSEIIELESMLNVAKKFVISYTGLDEEQIDLHEDFYIVIMVLCQDMYDNRSMYVDKSNPNRVVDTILGMHSINLL